AIREGGDAAGSLARSGRLLSLERAGERTLLLRLVGRSGVHEHLTEDAIQKPAARTDRDLRHELAGVGERGFEHLRVLLEEVRKRLQRQLELAKIDGRLDAEDVHLGLLA